MIAPTHGLVITTSKDISQKEGIYAFITLYLDSSESSSISGIKMIKSETGFAFVSPYYKIEGDKTGAVFKGKILQEDLIPICAAYLNQIKQDLGRISYASAYRVSKGKAEEIKETK